MFLDSSYLLVITIGVGDHLGDLRVILREQVLVVNQVGLVRVIGYGGLIGVGDERAVERVR